MSLYDPALRNHTVLIESDWNLKVVCQHIGLRSKPVLIESDWNLKSCDIWSNFALIIVLIESDWNLKLITSHKRLASVIVLIESDWNLKQGIAAYNGIGLRRINRIRLEFKENTVSDIFGKITCSNRIRLEFKVIIRIFLPCR